jgi:tyrosine-specific transport protein
MKKGVKKYLTASSILIGSCIGAGVLGIPYVAAQSGFFTTLIYLILIGGIIFLVNLYLGEVVLRTKGDHQLIGYVQKYLGKRLRHVMEFAVVFGVYAALIAYMLGIGKSLSFIIFGNQNYYIYFGILFGFFMTFLLKGGMKSLKKFEKIGVTIILGLLLVIMGIFLPSVDFVNLLGFNSANILLPFGVILFALMSFQIVPDVKIILKRNEKYFKKVMITGTLVSVIFYAFFTFVVVGVKGIDTPDVATLTLGPVFVILGIFTMFTSYLSGGNALRESFQFDERFSKRKSWVLASFIPIGLFVLTQLTDFFSFTRILSLGGVISGGIMAILILLMVKKAKNHCNRKPEYSIPAYWGVIGLLILIFVFGVIREVFI